MKYISINRTGLTYFCAKGRVGDFSGSSKWQILGGELTEKGRSKPNDFEHNTAGLEIDIERWLHLKDEQQAEQLAVWIDHQEDELKKQKLRPRKNTKSKIKKPNKSKLRGKLHALFALKASRKFIGFYSISFPFGTSEDVCFSIFNNWLTWCRKKQNLNNYIWVEEKQKNGTTHFHLLTNNRMPVRLTNAAMAHYIDIEVKKGNCEWGESSKEKYNGVDVDGIYNSKRHKKSGKSFSEVQQRQWITAYVTKYVTKNDSEFTHQCWHCSRSVSELFTSSIIEEREWTSQTKLLPNEPDKYIVIESDFTRTKIFRFIPNKWLFHKLNELNDYIFERHKPLTMNINQSITYTTKQLWN